VTVDLLIWLVVVILPFVLPVVAVIWLASRLIRWWSKGTPVRGAMTSTEREEV